MNAQLVLAGLAGAVIVALVVLAAVMGWGGQMSRTLRLGLCAMAAGLVGAGVGRAMQAPVGWFDVLFLGGLVVYLGRSYGAAILSHADACDGAADGRLNFHRRARPR